MPEQLGLLLSFAVAPAPAPRPALRAARPAAAVCSHCRGTARLADGSCAACGEFIHTTCPRVPGAQLCADAGERGCPGKVICEAREALGGES